MAIVAHLVERTGTPPRNSDRDGIQAMIVAIDDTVDTTAAAIQARAVTVAVAQGIDLPEGYFNANRSVAGVFDAAGDHAVFSGQKITETIA